MTNCIFCDVSDDMLILRDEDGFVILDDPVRPGHVLIGARAHGETLSDLSAEDAEAMMRLANRTAKTIVTALGAEKVYVVAIGDKDKHFHVHLLPKMKDDPKLGPYVFGAQGWVSFLPTEVDHAGVSNLSAIIRSAAQR